MVLANEIPNSVRSTNGVIRYVDERVKRWPESASLGPEAGPPVADGGGQRRQCGDAPAAALPEA